MRRLVILVVLAWLAAGVVAAAQRDHFTGPSDCDRVTTIAATAIAGPLNYTGAEPTVSCR
ncbi:hypothetical protein [Catellatospora methionotrophica]|uniref:hypothetical protein n=1 Tax=Catellatospora methionotrophica TaxID=121620 RepID=UPI0033F40F1A